MPCSRQPSWLLGDVVDDAARCAEAVQEAAGALQQVDLLHHFQRPFGTPRGDLQAVDAVAVVVQVDAAVADRRAPAAGVGADLGGDRRVEQEDFAQRNDLALLDLLAADGGDGKRGIAQGAVAEGAGFGMGAFGGDLDRIQVGGTVGVGRGSGVGGTGGGQGHGQHGQAGGTGGQHRWGILRGQHTTVRGGGREGVDGWDHAGVPASGSGASLGEAAQDRSWMRIVLFSLRPVKSGGPGSRPAAGSTRRSTPCVDGLLR